MNTDQHLEIGREYYWKRSDGWTWIDGQERWWEVFVEASGFNGAGGYWIEERWRWNGSSETIRAQIRTLSAEETCQIEAEVFATKQAEAKARWGLEGER